MSASGTLGSGEVAGEKLPALAEPGPPVEVERLMREVEDDVRHHAIHPPPFPRRPPAIVVGSHALQCRNARSDVQFLAAAIRGLAHGALRGPAAAPGIFADDHEGDRRADQHDPGQDHLREWRIEREAAEQQQ